MGPTESTCTKCGTAIWMSMCDAEWLSERTSSLTCGEDNTPHEPKCGRWLVAAPRA